MSKENKVSKDREFDVIVLGATGFTGKLVVEYLVQRYGCDPKDTKKNPEGLKFAIAGRSLEKLKQVQSEMIKVHESAANLTLIVSDVKEIDQVVVRTRVLLSTVGPFAIHGEPVVRACAKNGTDYVDITGESHWVREMIDKYEADAKRTGALIVSCCGYDSIPSDIGTYELVTYVKEKLKQEPIRVHAIHAAKGGVSGGTLASMFNIVENVRDPKIMNPFLLNPEGTAPSPPRPHDKDIRWIQYNEDFSSWTGFFVMAGVNTRVVRRSAALLEYGSQFSYNETMKFSSMIAAAFTTIMIYLFLLLAFIPPTRWLLKKVLPAPGQGPSRKTMLSGHFKSQFVAETNKKTKVYATMKGPEPGYYGTARMLAESALVLVVNRKSCPAGGFHTPASAFGQKLLPRLAQEKFTFEISPVADTAAN